MSRFLRNTSVQTIEFERDYHFTTSDIDSLINVLNQSYISRNGLDDANSSLFNDESSIEYRITTLLNNDSKYLIFLLLHNVSVINFTMMCDWFDVDGNGYGTLSVDSLLDYIMSYDTVHRLHRKNEIYTLIKQTPLQLTEDGDKTVLLSMIYDIFTDYDNSVELINDGLYFVPIINHVIDNDKSFRNYRTSIVEYRKIVDGVTSDINFTSMAGDYIKEIYTSLLSSDPLLILPITRDSMFTNIKHSSFYKRCLMGIKQTLSNFLLTLDLLIDDMVLNNVSDDNVINEFYKYIKSFTPSTISSEDDLDKLLFVSFFNKNNIDDEISKIDNDINSIRQWLITIREQLKQDKRYKQIVKEGDIL